MAGTLRRRQAYLPEDLSSGITTRVAGGTIWSGIGVGSTTALNFFRSVIFARLLEPADFGIITLANVFAQFILLFASFGFTSSVIYQRELTREDLSSCWWGNLAVDVSAVLGCIGFAFLSSSFLGTPQVPWVIFLLSIQYLVTSLSSINAALMRRQFKFKEIAIINTVGAAVTILCGVVAVIGGGMGVYGLVAGMAFGSLFMSALNFLFLPWLPSLTFSWRAFRSHINYGRWFLGTNIVAYTNQNADRMIVGTTLTTTQMGYYDYANTLPTQLTLLFSQIFNFVLFPTFAGLRHNTLELKRVLLRANQLSVMFVYPLLVGFALVSREFVLLAYGAKWLPIVAPMQVFCAVGLLRVLTSPQYALSCGIGKPHMMFKWSLVALPFNTAILAFGLRAGVLGVAIASVLLPVFMLATLGREAAAYLKLSTREVFRPTVPTGVCCAVMAAFVLAVKSMFLTVQVPLALSFAVQVIVGALAYFIALRLLFRTSFHEIRVLARRLGDHVRQRAAASPPP